MKSIGSYEELKSHLKQEKTLWLLIFKKGMEQSDLALERVQNIEKGSTTVYYADVNLVKDIHPVYNITTAPSLLQFKDGKLTNVVKGAQTSDQYENLLSGNSYVNNAEQKKNKTVIVYTTPTCSWCNTLKGYLRSAQITFKEIDVSRDQNMAQKMVQKSGQQGVPQTEINGQMIVGFDRDRINKLLEIN
ncbi:glutaredoxin domain-containing protein [Sunxiuqinia sp. A32]|uniref:glutaredoxin domain-containing protein n=1 Tax=Sunxiuqinia sp. A32 TaxID=3461496 RepID=UPI0040458D2C